MKVVITTTILSLLFACTPITSNPEIATVGTSTETNLIETSTLETSTPTFHWSSNSDDIILQYDMLGGLMGTGAGTDLPLWTLYGDGLLVWTEDGLPTPGFTRQIWVGHLSDAEIEVLLIFVEEEGFWELDSSYQPEQFISPTISAEGNPEGFTVVMPNPDAALDQASGALMVATTNLLHQVTVFPAGWPNAPEAYQTLRQHILEIRPDDATIFTPMTFSLRARELTQISADDPQIVAWPYTDIQLSQVASMPLSLDKEQGLNIADFMETNGQKVVQNETVYVVTLLANPPR